MPILMRLLGMLLLLIIGIVCLRNPMKIAFVIVQWAKIVSGGSISDPKARDAVFLMENDPNEYANKFAGQLEKIERMGILALVISTVGSCLIIFGK